MPRKLTNELVDERIKDKSIRRISDYINNRTKIKWRCLIDGYEWYATPSRVMSKRQQGCPKCVGSLMLSNQEFDDKLKNVTQNIQRLQDYVGTKKTIKWKCLLDNHEWVARPSDIIRGSGCPKCSKHIPIDNDYVDKKISEQHLPVIRLENVSTSRKKIKWRCLIDGYEWLDTPNNVINLYARQDEKYKYFGCKECRRRERVAKHNGIADRAAQHVNIRRLSDFTNTSAKMHFCCNKCGKQFYSNYSDVVYSLSGCPHCKLKGENFVHSVLIKAFSEYKICRQHTVQKSAGTDKRKKFVIDFVLRNGTRTIFLEFHGGQHYRPTKFSSKTSDVQVKRAFVKQQKRDKDLRQYCNHNKIQLVEMPYWILKDYDYDATKRYIICELAKVQLHH